MYMHIYMCLTCYTYICICTSICIICMYIYIYIYNIHAYTYTQVHAYALSRNAPSRILLVSVCAHPLPAACPCINMPRCDGSAHMHLYSLINMHICLFAARHTLISKVRWTRTHTCLQAGSQGCVCIDMHSHPWLCRCSCVCRMDTWIIACMY